MCYNDTDTTPRDSSLMEAIDISIINSQSIVTLDFFFFFFFLVLVSGVQNHNFGFLSQQLSETKNLAG